MKITKRLISLLLAFLMLVSILPAVDLSADAATVVYATDIVEYARQYIGYPYRLGTKGPNSFDCAGFVNYVFKHFGITLPTNASSYFYNPTKYGTLIDTRSVSKAKMGDVIAWEGHVAIYTEDGYCVEALGTNYGVCEQVKVDRHSNGMNYKVIRIYGVQTENHPVITSISNTAAGVQVEWNKYRDYKNYRLYRKTASTDWVKVADVASTSFVDTSVKSGTKYFYTVRSKSADGTSFTSGYDSAGTSITFLSPPKLAEVTNTATGVKISWNKLSGAAKYRVFYKTGSGGWTKIGDTTSTSYTWTGAKSGTNYKFTVRSITSDGKSYTSGYDSAGMSIIYIAAPVISSVEGTNSGVNISWGTVKGAAKYRVFCKTGSGSWTKIADTASTSYKWTDAKEGTKYVYTVRCLSADGKAYTSGFDSTGRSLTTVATPVLSSVYTNNSGVYISWDKVKNAEKYRIFYKANGESTWHKAGDTTSTSYTWTGAKKGTNYVFTVRCITSDGKVYTSGYDTVGLTFTPVATPTLSVEASNSGVNISWNAVKGAEKYRVYYKTGSGSWTKITDTDSTSYTWTGAKEGTKYVYTVRCLSADGKVYTSGFDSTGKSLTTVATPALSSVYAYNSGVFISWDKVNNAEKYRVFYKANGESTWHKVCDTASTSYIWTGSKNNTNYVFTVRCISSDGKIYTSGYDTEGLTLTPVATPALSSVAADNTGTVVKWNAVNGAERYKVYRKTASGSWTALGTTTSTSFTDSTAKSGTKYIYTVRCISADGKVYTSGYDSTGKSLTAVAAPVLSEVSNAATGVAISWGKVSGAEKYRVFYKANGESTWHKVTDTAATSYTWTGAESGMEYTFSVRCITSDGKVYTSGYDTEGLSIIYLSAPKLSSVTNVETGVQLKWNAVTGAENYRVFYKSGNSGWIKITDTDSTSYTWTEATSGTDYKFTVRCLSADGKAYTSGYDTAGMSLTYISAPVLSSVSANSSGIVIKWNKSTGAEKYRVYYKTGSGSWTKIGDTASASYTWTGAKKGTEYTFTVRCISSDAKTFTSGYDPIGISIIF